MEFPGDCFAPRVCGLIVAASVLLAGCNKEDSGGSVLKPKEAASHLQQAFQKADADTKNSVTAASDALRNADYEKAVVSLEVIKARQDLSLQQGMAVHESQVALEARLISAMAAGDPKAKQAYELLKQSRRE